MRPTNRDWSFVLAIYGGLSLLLTYPLIRHPAARILGDGDAWRFTWNMWWMRWSLQSFNHPFCTDYIHYPDGVRAYLHTRNFPATLASVPLQAIVSLVSLYNFFAFLSFVLSGWGMYRLARFLGIHRSAALITGLAFTFSPFHFAQSLGHLNLMSYQWLLFFLQSFISLLRSSGSFRNTLACAAWLTLAALTDWHYLVFGVFAIAILVPGGSKSSGVCPLAPPLASRQVIRDG